MCLHLNNFVAPILDKPNLDWAIALQSTCIQSADMICILPFPVTLILLPTLTLSSYDFLHYYNKIKHRVTVPHFLPGHIAGFRMGCKFGQKEKKKKYMQRLK